MDLCGLRGTEVNPTNRTIPPPELNAEQREAVLMVRGMFLAYVAAGFTEEQAMDLVKTHLMAAKTQ